MQNATTREGPSLEGSRTLASGSRTRSVHRRLRVSHDVNGFIEQLRVALNKAHDDAIAADEEAELQAQMRRAAADIPWLTRLDY